MKETFVTIWAQIPIKEYSTQTFIHYELEKTNSLDTLKPLSRWDQNVEQSAKVMTRRQPIKLTSDRDSLFCLNGHHSGRVLFARHFDLCRSLVHQVFCLPPVLACCLAGLEGAEIQSKSQFDILNVFHFPSSLLKTDKHRHWSDIIIVIFTFISHKLNDTNLLFITIFSLLWRFSHRFSFVANRVWKNIIF